jgi:hypothetical protein
MSQSVLRRLMPVTVLLAALLASCVAATGACAADRLIVGMQLEPPVLELRADIKNSRRAAAALLTSPWAGHIVGAQT